MDDLLSLISVLVVLGALIAMLILPIVALVISVNTRKKFNKQTSKFGGEVPRPDDASLAGVVQQLTARVAKLEAAIASRRGSPSDASEQRVEPPQPSSVVAEPFAS